MKTTSSTRLFLHLREQGIKHLMRVSPALWCPCVPFALGNSFASAFQTVTEIICTCRGAQTSSHCHFLSKRSIQMRISGIHEHMLPGDVARPFRQQEHHHISDLFRPRHALSQRNLRDNSCQLFFGIRER